MKSKKVNFDEDKSVKPIFTQRPTLKSSRSSSSESDNSQNDDEDGGSAASLILGDGRLNRETISLVDDNDYQGYMRKLTKFGPSNMISEK